MELTTVETSVHDALEDTAAEKTKKSFFGHFFSTYKIPLVSFILFGSFTLRVLHPETFNFSFKRQKTYRFKNDRLGFFIGDMSFFANNSYEEAEERVVELFPEKLRNKVNKVIRPVLILCEKHQLDPFWVLSVMWTESHFKMEATSKKGARGLMQMMPQTYMETLADMKKSGIFLESDRGEEYLRYRLPKFSHVRAYNQWVYFQGTGLPNLLEEVRVSVSNGVVGQVIH